MTFLAPLALIGLLLLALPIIVHLFKPRKMKETPFSSLRWLKETHQRLSRRIQWHQWLLFLMRAGVIFFLVLALAKPLFGLWGSQSVDRFVIVDASRSLAYRTPDQPTPFERATDLAGRYVQAARVGERTAVIVAGSAPRLLAAPGADASSALPTLKSLQASQADGSVSAALPLVQSLLPTRPEREVEIVFLTDNLKGRWQEPDVRGFVTDLANPTRVKVIETGQAAGHNAWIADARAFKFSGDDDRFIIAAIGCNSEANATRSVRLAGIAGLPEDTQAATLKPGALTRVEFRIPASIDLQGQVAELRLEPNDGLASDDVFFVNLDTSLALRVLLIEPEAPGADGRNAGLYLRAAMSALALARNQAIELATRTPASVTPSDVQKSDVVLLAGAPDLPDSVLENLESRVRGGAGLALFLGPQLKASFANQKLFHAAQPTEGLLPMSLKDIDSGKPGVLTRVRWTHPLLAPLQDPVLSDFARRRFHTYANLAGTPGKADAVLARFDDETPAIIEHPLGAGRVLVLNMSANDEWSDLPKRDSFVPFVERTLIHLSAGVRKSVTVGEMVTLPLAEYQPGAEVKITRPTGSPLPARLLAQSGRTMLHLDEITEAGTYRIEIAGKKPFVLVANAPRRDSALAAMDAKSLQDWWPGVELEVISADAAAEQLSQQSSHWPLWPLFVLLAGMLLVAETIYVHRLCPRANPKTVEAVVPNRGVLKPVQTTRSE
ncbi:MAG TPA: BatA and WFA domain-containing protein [Gemmataceae bacterium]|nr:BatA and WFA domain-containing protein [Gemmataceae bacterium]